MPIFAAISGSSVVTAASIGRVALPEDQARVICFLASSDADFVTGPDFRVVLYQRIMKVARLANPLTPGMAGPMLAWDWNGHS